MTTLLDKQGTQYHHCYKKQNGRVPMDVHKLKFKRLLKPISKTNLAVKGASYEVDIITINLSNKILHPKQGCFGKYLEMYIQNF